MLLLLLLTFCTITLAKKTDLVCCSQTDLDGTVFCVSNFVRANCVSNGVADPKTANCCKSKAFSCDQYFIQVGADSVASTCDRGNGNGGGHGNGGGDDTDTTTEDEHPTE